MKTKFSTLLACMLAVALLAAPLASQAQQAPAKAEEQQSPTKEIGSEVGWGVGTVLANVFYMPTKVVYAGLGLLTGGIGYMLTAGRGDVANEIIYPAVKGTYVLTTDHLKGEQPVVFIGPGPDDQPPEQVSKAPSDSNLEPR
ncbi:MAG TPA: hypothetical protein VL754_20965 [Verrucomicrobiae bacterium]|jgi:hypothetical protein|nr:hypothetical protein [Verrucomicrobiae bacterium]